MDVSLTFTFSFGQPKEKANKKKGCRLRIRCYSGDSAGYSARKLAATRGSSDRCLTSRRPHRLRFTPRMLMSGDPDGRQAIGASPVRPVRTGRRVTVRLVAAACCHVETRLIASLLGFHAFTGRRLFFWHLFFCPHKRKVHTERQTNVEETPAGSRPCTYAGFRPVRTGRQANPRPWLTGVKRTTQRGR